MGIDIKQNRAAQKYSYSEYLYRCLWGIGRVMFRISPRPCYGMRRVILRVFGATVGSEVNIYSSALIYYPWNLKIGDHSSIGEWALIYNLGQVTIGERTTISQRVHLCAGTHDYKDPAMPLVKSSIEICDDVWVCADAFVGAGVVINDSSIVAARAVVVKNVAKAEIVAGNPAVFKKFTI